MRHKHYTYPIINPHHAQPAALAGRMAIHAVKVEDFHSKRRYPFRGSRADGGRKIAGTQRVPDDDQDRDPAGGMPAPALFIRHNTGTGGLPGIRFPQMILHLAQRQRQDLDQHVERW